MRTNTYLKLCHRVAVNMTSKFVNPSEVVILYKAYFKTVSPSVVEFSVLYYGLLYRRPKHLFVLSFQPCLNLYWNLISCSISIAIHYHYGVRLLCCWDQIQKRQKLALWFRIIFLLYEGGLQISLTVERRLIRDETKCMLHSSQPILYATKFPPL